MTERIGPAHAEAHYEAGDATAWCPSCEGSGTVSVQSRKTGAVHQVQCGVCKGEGTV